MDVNFVKDNYIHKYEITDATGVEKTTTENKINVTPTITKDNLTITADKAGFIVDVISMTGASIMKETSADSSLNMNVSHLPSGVYIVKVSQADGSTTKRFIKK